jgi:7,8-didemethyl-8-hydroxy-5-deazariboflavin synthase CofH subunit
VSSTLQTMMGTGLVDPEFEEILHRAICGEELTVEDGERLFQAKGAELDALVHAADEVRLRRVGNTVTYVVNRNLNFTNICTGSCRFCAFRRTKSDPDAYVLTPAQIASKVREALAFGATEICVQGGLHPDFGLEKYVEILRSIREISQNVHIHAFSPAEIDHVANLEGASVKKAVKTLRDAGLDSVPGTAAEILVDRVRSIICPKKITTSRWVEIIKICHRLELPTTATMLYGHVETARDRAEHLAMIRDIQRETHGFTEFVPLAFVPGNTQLQASGIVKEQSNLSDSLRVHAIARLMLAGCIDNVQASWVKLGHEGAQLMLMAGANDLGGTLLEENITRAAGGRLYASSPEQLNRLILEIERIPRQRTTTYKLI